MMIETKLMRKMLKEKDASRENPKNLITRKVRKDLKHTSEEEGNDTHDKKGKEEALDINSTINGTKNEELKDTLGDEVK